MSQSNIITDLFAIIEDRKANPKEDSYTNFLLDTGQEEILKKIGEESIEVILAAAHQTDERLLSELADLTYHALVLLAARGLTPADVAAELERRFNH
jgi:phosphoribosyl-ATP pyrophosphohydrolase